MAGEVMGLKEIQRAIDREDERIRGSLRAALYEEGLAIDAKSVRLVPVDFGRLRATHFVAPPDRGPNPTVEIGYGTDYAVHVHEKQARHNPPTQWKYLEQPMEAAKMGYTLRLAKRVRRMMERGITDVFSGQVNGKPVDPGETKNRHTTRKKRGLPKGGAGKRIGLKGARR